MAGPGGLGEVGNPGPDVMVWVVPVPFCWDEERGGAPGTLVNPDAWLPGPLVLVLTCWSCNMNQAQKEPGLASLSKRELQIEVQSGLGSDADVDKWHLENVMHHSQLQLGTSLAFTRLA